MSADIPVTAGTKPVTVAIDIMSSFNERVIITSDSKSFSQTYVGTGTETVANLDLPRTSAETYHIQIDHAKGKEEWKPSKVELNNPQLSPSIGSYYVLGYDNESAGGGSEPNVSVVFTWANV